MKEGRSREKLQGTMAEARRLLESPLFFSELLKAFNRIGLVGEEKNALALFVVAVSRLQRQPLNAIVKGQSSSGKNWLVSRVLQLLPKSCVIEITSSSSKAWNYSAGNFRHKIVYLQERNEAAGAIHPVRLLISEGKLTRLVTVREGSQYTTKRYDAEGPVAAISTTTKNRLELDDETRHISLWVDESEEQTRRIIRSCTQDRREDHDQGEPIIWHAVQHLLEKRAAVEPRLPGWFEGLADHAFAGDVRMRRYFPAFLAACCAVCLLRSFRRGENSTGALEVSFTDFATTAIIFSEIFTESLHRDDDSSLETRTAVDRISQKKSGPVEAQDLAQELGISSDRAYRQLRAALRAGTVRRVNGPEKDNRKLFLPAPIPRFIPDPEEVFRKVDCGLTRVKFVHPITGQWVIYAKKNHSGR
jgi:DNA primase